MMCILFYEHTHEILPFCVVPECVTLFHCVHVPSLRSQSIYRVHTRGVNCASSVGTNSPLLVPHAELHPPAHTSSLAPLWLSHTTASQACSKKFPHSWFAKPVSHTQTPKKREQTQKKKRVESGKPRSSTTTTVRDNSGSGRGHFYLFASSLSILCVYTN